jgi:hypothetical protein
VVNVVVNVVVNLCRYTAAGVIGSSGNLILVPYLARFRQGWCSTFHHIILQSRVILQSTPNLFCKSHDHVTNLSDTRA